MVRSCGKRRVCCQELERNDYNWSTEMVLVQLIKQSPHEFLFALSLFHQRFLIKTYGYCTGAFYNRGAVPFGGNRPKSCSRLNWDIENNIHLEWRED